MDIFSPITSKIFGVTSILLALAFAALLISKNAVIHSQDKQIASLTSSNSDLRVDLATARGNEATLKSELASQSTKVQATADAANMVAKAGAAAVEQVKKAGQGTYAKLDRIKALPEASCADADAILLQGAK